MAENVQTFTDGNFDSSVLKAAQPVLVDFWAEWCGPCKRLAPAVDALATDYAGKVTIGKLNVDDNPDTTIKFNVRGIPALLLFKGGQVVDQVVGLVPKDEIRKVIDKHLREICELESWRVSEFRRDSLALQLRDSPTATLQITNSRTHQL